MSRLWWLALAVVLAVIAYGMIVIARQATP
jgi:hypothetical protein